eukprot:jgi/Hompol1/1079/HPOL_001375-RA
MPSLFSVPIFFIVFRETLEGAIIVSVLLAIIGKLARTSPRFAELAGSLSRQVWLGTVSGLSLSLAIGAVFLVFWYKYAVNLWSQAEQLWEGIFGLVACVMVTLTALAMLKSSRMHEKYQRKLAAKLELMDAHLTPASHSGTAAVAVTAANEKKSAGTHVEEASQIDPRNKHGKTRSLRDPLKILFWVPFVTMLREGLEAVVFIGGVSLSEEAKSIPLAAICGILLGCLLGFLVHRGGSQLTMHWLFIISACVLLLIADGLLARSVGEFGDYTWSKAINLAADDVGTGAFDPRYNVWHFDCCSPEEKSSGGWGVFNSLLGWRNNASVATITVYCVFWILVSGILVLLRLRENHKIRRREFHSKHSNNTAKDAELTEPINNSV